jgi:hypothetical protein
MLAVNGPGEALVLGASLAHYANGTWTREAAGPGPEGDVGALAFADNGLGVAAYVTSQVIVATRAPVGSWSVHQVAGSMFTEGIVAAINGGGDVLVSMSSAYPSDAYQAGVSQFDATTAQWTDGAGPSSDNIWFAALDPAGNGVLMDTTNAYPYTKSTNGWGKSLPAPSSSSCTDPDRTFAADSSGSVLFECTGGGAGTVDRYAIGSGWAAAGWGFRGSPPATTFTSRDGRAFVAWTDSVSTYVMRLS